MLKEKRITCLNGMPAVTVLSKIKGFCILLPVLILKGIMMGIQEQKINPEI